MFKIISKASLVVALGVFVVGCAPGNGTGGFYPNKYYRGPAPEEFKKTPLPVNIPGQIATESLDLRTKSRLRETFFVADNVHGSKVTHKNPKCTGTIKYEGTSGKEHYFLEYLDNPYSDVCPAKSMIVIAIDPTIKDKNQFFYGRYTSEGKMLEKGFAYRK